MVVPVKESIDDYVYDDFEIVDSTNTPKNLNWDVVYKKCTSENIDTDGEIFFAFYSTSCYYCNRSAQMMGISKRAFTPKQKIILVFPGTLEDTENFISRNKCHYPFIRLTKEEFLSIAGYEFPAYFKVNDKKTTNSWTGRTLNYTELNNLFK